MRIDEQISVVISQCPDWLTDPNLKKALSDYDPDLKAFTVRKTAAGTYLVKVASAGFTSGDVRKALQDFDPSLKGVVVTQTDEALDQHRRRPTRINEQIPGRVVRRLVDRILSEDDDEFGPQDHQPYVGTGNVRIIRTGEKIPAGAKRVHLYPAQNILRPRGSMEKESLSLAIFDRLRDVFDYWSDTEYADALSPEKLTSVMKQNLHAEVEAAWKAFMDGQ